MTRETRWPTALLWLILAVVVIALVVVIFDPFRPPPSSALAPPSAQPGSSPTTSGTVGAGINGTIPKAPSTDGSPVNPPDTASTSGARVIPGVTPDPRISPGDVLTTDTRQICTPGYTKTVRNVPQELKAEVYREYGINHRQPGEYEVDHVISLELGGSNSIRNLFPQSYRLHPLNAHIKDRLEDRLHALVCNGKIPITQAQQAISRDWIGAYRRYIGPVPTN